MTSAAIARARKEEAIKERPFDKRPARTKPEPPKCYVCGTTMSTRGLPGGKVQGGICRTCWARAQAQRDEVKRNREAAKLGVSRG